MSKRILPVILFFVLLVILASSSSFSQAVSSGTVRIMFYNVENLFDIHDDTLTDDNAFLPDGIMRWNSVRYNKKLNSLYKVIVAAGEWDPPALIAFSEIENKTVLEDLIYGTYLAKSNYSIIHEDSPDKRGIDVCLIYRKNVVRILDYKYWIPADPETLDFNSRSVLYTKLLLSNDTIHLIVNHWPSRRGGVLAGEDLRFLIASMIRQKADSLIAKNPEGSKIIVLGDFNCSPDDKVIKSMCRSMSPGNSFINLSESLKGNYAGTYRYMGTWEIIDQVMVSTGLLSTKQGFYTKPDQLRILRPDFVLKKDYKYPGYSPFSTYRGYKYQGGYSDHLPILIDLQFR